jgi:two-component system OmpR family sensor kinase
VSIRSQIIMVVCACFAIVLTLLALAFINLRGSTYTVERARLANQQLEAMAQIAVASNRHSEQVAERLLLGERERADLDRARTQMAEALGRLKRLVEEEAELISDPEERRQEAEELERIEKLRAKFAELDGVVNRILAFERSGQSTAAVDLFRARIEDGLDDELEAMIDAGIADERAEAVNAEAQSRDVARRLLWWMVSLSAVFVAGAAAAGYGLYRSIAKPLSVLTGGAQAIARGDLGHRIGAVGGSEFGFLARQFDEMSGSLERQHAQLREAQENLERKVARRTEELHRANTRLVELDRQRVRFLADASHELRTPLTVLRGEADVALRGTAKPARLYRETLERIVVQAADMGRLVDDLLFLARSEADDMRYEMARLDPALVVAEAIDGIGALARRRGIDFRLADGAARPIVGDAKRLKQALMIVLDNAVKYSKTRGRVDVGIAQDAAGTSIAIRDQGIGIAADELPRVYDRFFRGEAARAETGGSGLGLTIARRIVEKHGGAIEVASVEGRGTEVHIALPERELAS